MRIESCGGCGKCIEFKCPENAFKFVKTNGYASAQIDPLICTDCGLCLYTIECLMEAITNGF